MFVLDLLVTVDVRQEGRKKEGAPIFERAIPGNTISSLMSKQGVKEGPFSPFEFWWLNGTPAGHGSIVEAAAAKHNWGDNFDLFIKGGD